jgi:hypothetical protein
MLKVEEMNYSDLLAKKKKTDHLSSSLGVSTLWLFNTEDFHLPRGNKNENYKPDFLSERAPHITKPVTV